MPYSPPTDPWLVVVHEDRDLLVVDKPSGLLSVPGREPGWEDSALTRALRDRANVRPVHRLDMDTSGLLVFALRKKAEKALYDQFAARTVAKTYVARVWGQPPDEGVIDLPIAREGGSPPKNRVDPNGLPAVTRYRVIGRDDRTALVEVRPETGRSHQIRVHLLAIGHPVLGDRFYAPDEVVAAAPRLLLHAASLAIDHPYSGARLAFTAPVPF